MKSGGNEQYFNPVGYKDSGKVSGTSLRICKRCLHRTAEKEDALDYSLQVDSFSLRATRSAIQKVLKRLDSSVS